MRALVLGVLLLVAPHAHDGRYDPFHCPPSVTMPSTNPLPEAIAGKRAGHDGSAANVGQKSIDRNVARHCEVGRRLHGRAEVPAPIGASPRVAECVAHTERRAAAAIPEVAGRREGETTNIEPQAERGAWPREQLHE